MTFPNSGRIRLATLLIASAVLALPFASGAAYAEFAATSASTTPQRIEGFIPLG